VTPSALRKQSFQGAVKQRFFGLRALLLRHFGPALFIQQMKLLPLPSFGVANDRGGRRWSRDAAVMMIEQANRSFDQ
jgi:hypothetical protein